MAGAKIMANGQEMQALLASMRAQQQPGQGAPAGPVARSFGRSSLLNQPPQRRAHILLQEMAGLTDRLVDIAEGMASWSHEDGNSVLSGWGYNPPEGQAAVTTKEILAILENHQALLVEAVAELSELQELEQEKQQIAAEIASKDSVLRAFTKRVRDAQQVLESAVEDMAELKRAKVGTSVPVAELVSYAHRISYTTFAPPEYASGVNPLRGALPPAPQDEQMRASMLYHVHELDLGFTKAFAPVSSPLAPPEVENEAGKVEPVMPAGWQPGMPVQLPSDLPPMPAGWKVGDPIPLPPGLEMPPLLPSAGLRPKMPVMPATIHVPHVTLDLNPELEEDLSSEYGSGSDSEEDDD